MKKEQEIQQLTERFLEGATSNAEEQTLYDYFAGEEVAESLKPYREMFRWYAAGMPQNRTESLQAVNSDFSACKVPLYRRKTPRRLLASAASLLLLIGIGFGYRYYQEQQELYAIYEGSYIIRNGVKNTDIKQILPELQATEQEVANALKQQNNNQVIPTI